MIKRQCKPKGEKMKKEMVTWSVVAMVSVIVAAISIISYTNLTGAMAVASIVVNIVAMITFVASINFAFGGEAAAEQVEKHSASGSGQVSMMPTH